jgi:WD40 repeat protein
LAYDDTLLITWFEQDNLIKVWDLKSSVLIKQIKSPIKAALVKSQVHSDVFHVSGDFVYTSHSPKNVIAKFSINEGKFVSSFQGSFIWHCCSNIQHSLRVFLRHVLL